MSTPHDPWSQRAQNAPRDDQPTEDISAPTEHYYTADPRQAYGEHVPTEVHGGYAPTEPYGGYTPTESYGGRYAPTQQYPTYDYARQGEAYSQTGYPPPTNPTLSYPTEQGPYGQYPGEIPPLEQQKRPKRTGLWAGLGVLVVLLAVVVGAIALSSRDSTPTAAQSPTTARLQPRTSPPPPQRRQTQAPPTTGAQPPGGQNAPGLGGVMNDLGAAMGTITANDGSTITLANTVGDGTTTVRTDEQTEVVSATGNKVSDLKVGDTVLAQGDRAGDGSFHAKVIVAMALPNLGGFGR